MAGLKLSPRQVAVRAHVTVTAVRNIGAGLQVHPSVHAAVKIQLEKAGAKFFSEMDRMPGSGVFIA